MGLFSGDRVINVASTVYNLAGPEDERPNYLKTLVISNVFAEENETMSDTINTGYLTGPGIKLRSFGNWAINSYYNYEVLNYNQIKLKSNQRINVEDVLPIIETYAGTADVVIELAEVGKADFTYWVDNFLSENYPERMNDEMTLDLDESDYTAVITFLSDNTTASFQLTGFNPRKEYLYIGYKTIAENVPGSVVQGTPVLLGSSSFPDRTGWNVISNSSSDTDVTLTETTTVTSTYSDGRPEENSTTNTDTVSTFTESTTVYERFIYEGTDPNDDALYSTKEIANDSIIPIVNTSSNTTTIEEEIEPGVTKTTVTVVDTESVESGYQVRIDTQKIIDKSWSTIKFFIYEEETGNAELDALFGTKYLLQDQMFPFIPVRHDGTFISSSFRPDAYERSKYALKRATKGKLDDVISELEDNEAIDDIDYAHIVFGVSLNVQENASKKYLFNFFRLMVETGLNGEPINITEASWNTIWEQQQIWLRWYNAQQDPNDPLFGTSEPSRGKLSHMPYQFLWVNTFEKWGYDVMVEWQTIEEFTGIGKAKPEAKSGELWFEVGETIVFQETIVNRKAMLDRSRTSTVVTLYWQEDNNNWRAMVITGLRYKNYVYEGKAVEISAEEALADEEESGFIIPLHTGVFKQMSLKDSTQMSTACVYLVLNSYEVTKEKWYQTGAFKVFIVIAAIAVTIVTGGAGAGLLGSAVSVGASLGFTGITAIIVGTVANALAAIVLTSIISRGATALFGDKLGSVIAVIATVVAMSAGTAYMNGSSMSMSFGSMTRADNLLRLTNAASKGYSEYLQSSLQETSDATTALIAEYESASQEINDRYEEMFGGYDGIVDSSVIADSLAQSGSFESRDSFLERTLLVGSDIAELSMKMLDNFVEMTTSTELSK